MKSKRRKTTRNRKKRTEVKIDERKQMRKSEVNTITDCQ